VKIPIFEARLGRHHLDPSEQEETLLRILREIEEGPSSQPAVI
jgi:hypothetical protein